MDAVLKRSLDAIESSLASLLESVSADDPSADAAAALVAADDELSSSLEQLVTHQKNHQNLLHLRALSSALDAELSSLLTTLSSARTELLATPTTIFPPNSRQVQYDALLSYATKISKFTRPPTHLKQQGQGATPPSTALVVKSETNGNNAASEGAAGNTSGDATAGAGESTGNAATRPTAEDIAMLDPSANMPFAPWPSEDVMKRGILANMGYMDTVPDAAAGDQPSEGAPAAPTEGAAPGVVPSADRQMTDADRERAREEAARREAERKAKEQEVFQGLDLYDPDSD
ncbi:hypothetical protein H072_11133 [Dactylellina haptotyla CBS 200.50]|uniref:Mediator of RNA polymerase II transcription subunit 4 n=1 Tax=Dactylellina haptotyla (strain CBS 200.50) TaxID=1284197 RepID=S7ZYE7_DACHA|nr:hypothetical protein H072_11133 [Dactylellina haptotyla CBS 200.50]